MKTTKKPCLYLPVETKTREFEAKLLLSIHAAISGWRVYLGREEILETLAPFMPSGVYLAKNISASKFDFLKRLKQYGHTIYALDEEAGLTSDDFKNFSKNRFHEDSLNIIDKILLWTAEQKKIFCEQYPANAPKAVATGSPRLDLLTANWKETTKATEKYFREKYGTFILFSSNFTVNYLIEGDFFEQRVKKALSLNISKAEVDAWIELKKKTFSNYCDALQSMADAFPGLNFVIRPHPAENPNTWRSVAEKKSNLHVDSTGPLVGPIRASAAVLHHGCTAAIEAILNNTPAIYYEPVSVKNNCSSLFYPAASANASFFCDSEEGLKNVINKVQAGSVFVSGEMKHALKEKGIFQDGLSYKRIINELENGLGAGKIQPQNPPSVAPCWAKALCNRPTETSKVLLRMALGKNTRGGRIILKKCPYISKKDVYQNELYREIKDFSNQMRVSEKFRNILLFD